MTVEYRVYTIKPNDTIQRIAALHNCPWELIAEINHLEPPYIVPTTYQREGFASGTVLIRRRRQTTQPYHIPKGTLLLSTILTHPIYFYTQEAITFTPTEEVTSVTIRAESPGNAYNLPPGSPLRFADQTLHEAFEVQNTSGIVGGFIKRVKKYGETIYLPITEQPAPPPDLIRAYGVDVALNDRLELEISPLTRDLVICGGVDNLIAATSRMLTTQRGSYLLHPEYGSNLTQYLGEPLSPELRHIIEIEVRETLHRDPRIEEVQDITVTYQTGETIHISCRVVTKTNLVFPLQVVI